MNITPLKHKPDGEKWTLLGFALSYEGKQVVAIIHPDGEPHNLFWIEGSTLRNLFEQWEEEH